jgi:hypothetical protein
MRSNELIEGVELVDSEGNVKGTSKIAAKRVGKISFSSRILSINHKEFFL